MNKYLKSKKAYHIKGDLNRCFEFELGLWIHTNNLKKNKQTNRKQSNQTSVKNLADLHKCARNIQNILTKYCEQWLASTCQTSAILTVSKVEIIPSLCES